MFFVPKGESGSGYLVVPDDAEEGADDGDAGAAPAPRKDKRAQAPAGPAPSSDSERGSVQRQSTQFWNAICAHQELLGIVLTIVLMAVLWVTFGYCKVCVLVVFIISSLLCMRLPYLQIVFWPSLFILLLNLHLLRGLHVKVDIPVGETIDNFLAPVPTKR